MSSPLESPDVMQMLLPMQDLRATNTNSLASIKLSSVDSLQLAKPPTSILNQVRPPNRVASSNSCSSSTTATIYNHHTYNNNQTSVISQQAPLASLSHTPRPIHHYLHKNSTSSQNTASAAGASGKSLCSIPETEISPDSDQVFTRPPPLEFSLSSVGRSFFESEDGDGTGADVKSLLLQTPDTPSANITPSSSSNRFSDKSFTDSRTHEYYLDMGDDEHEFEANKNSLKMMFDLKSKMRQENYCGSWDLLEIDLDFHEVNLDPSFGGDVQEYIFMGEEDPYGVLPKAPTQPDTLNL